MTNASVSMKWDGQSLDRINQKALKAMATLSYDVASQAQRNAPKLTSALVNSIRVQMLGDVFYIRAGGIIAQSSAGPKFVNYAAAREVLPNRKNPASQHYMQKAFDTILSGNYMEHYFGDITK